MSGMFITVEGAEATGKTTQARLVVERLQERYPNKEIIFTKEPGSPHDDVCKDIRGILLGNSSELVEKCAMLLFLADRAQHMEKVIEPVLDNNGIVVSDRSSLSTVIYHLANLLLSEDPTDSFARYKFYDVIDFAQKRSPNYCFIATSEFYWSKDQLEQRGQLDRIEKFGDRFHSNVHSLFNGVAEDPLVEHANPMDDPMYLIKWRIKEMKCYPNKIIALPKSSSMSIDYINDFMFKKIASVVDSEERC